MTLPLSLVLAVFLVLGLGMAGTVGLWARADAAARGSDHPTAWGFLALTTLGLLYYLLAWRPNHEREHPRTRTERLLLAAAAGLVLGLVVAVVLAPPDVLTQALYWPVTAAIAVVVVYALAWRRDRKTEPRA